jgi:hypothetical protein
MPYALASMMLWDTAYESGRKGVYIGRLDTFRPLRLLEYRPNPRKGTDTMPTNRYDFEFQDEPQECDKGFPWTVVRTPGASHLDFIAVSHRHVGVRTHYFHRRTIGHRRVGCEACDAGNRSRWTGYLLGLSHPAGQRILFEFTPTAAQYLLPLYEVRESIRGLRIRASRPSKRENGTIVLAFRGYLEDPSALPDAVPIKPLLFNIWGLIQPADDEEHSSSRAELTQHEKEGLRKSRGRNGRKAEEVDQTLHDLAGQLRIPMAE